LIGWLKMLLDNIKELVYDVAALTPKENEQLGELFQYDIALTYIWKEFLTNYLNRQLMLRREILHELDNYSEYKYEYVKVP